MDLRKLDAAIAEHVMGWRRLTYAQHNPDNKYFAENTRLTSYWHNSDRKEMERAEVSDCVDCGTDFPAFAPSSDIASAWEVVEKMTLVSTGDGFAPVFELNNEKKNWDEKEWCAMFFDRWHCAHWPVGQEQVRAHADAAPLAICLAALKANGIDVSEWEG